VSAPVVVSVEPGNLETDVILGIPIIITFDQVIDPTTVNDATFALTGPGTTEVETAMNMATLGKLSPTGREYITGTFTFVTTGNTPPNTVVSFVPDRVLRKNTTYNPVCHQTSRARRRHRHRLVVFGAVRRGSLSRQCRWV
jgi:hypothetical protein